MINWLQIKKAADSSGNISNIIAKARNSLQTPRYEVYGAILGCLGDRANNVNYDVTEDLPDDPWKAIIKSSGLLTRGQLNDWHRWHVQDPDQKGVPYYFIVKDKQDGDKEYVWYTDDNAMMPINTPDEIALAKKAGMNKKLVPEQLDFGPQDTPVDMVKSAPTKAVSIPGGKV